MQKSTKIEVRLTPLEKSGLQEQADLEGTSVSTLVRDRSLGVSTAPAAPIDLEADELHFLRQDLALLEDEQTPQDVATYKAFAAANGIPLGKLLQRVVLHVNQKHLS